MIRQLWKDLIVVLLILGVSLVDAGAVRARVQMEYVNGCLSLGLQDEPLGPVLAEIAERADLVIFVPKAFAPENVTLQIRNLPLENALKQILKGFNVASVYHEVDGQIQLSAVKIFSKGGADGPMDVLVQEVKPVLAQRVSLFKGKYDQVRSDVLDAASYVHMVRFPSLVPAALEFENKEKHAWQEIQTLKTQINAEMDATRNKVFSLALLEKYEAFKTLQSSHVNTLERMDRVESFNAHKTASDQ